MNEELTKVLEGIQDETAKKTISEEIEKYSSIAKDVIEQRDELKKKLKEIDSLKAKEEEERLKSNQEFKTLAEKLKAELEAKESELESLKPFKEKYDLVETERRNELLDKLESADKELAKDFPLDKLKKYVEIHGKENGAVHANRGGGRSKDVTKLTLDDFRAMGDEEKDALKKSHPAIYNGFIRENLGRK